MGALSITGIDIVFAVVLVISAGLAFARGLVYETFAIVEWVAAAWTALRFTPALEPLLGGVISPAWLKYGVVFLGTFLIVLIPLSFLSQRLEEAVRRSDVGPVDRVLGFLFGVGRGLVIAALAFIVYAALVPEADRSPMLTHARSYGLIRTTSAMLLDLVPNAKASGLRLPKLAPTPTQSAAGEPAAGTAKTYGAGERRALDRLIEATGEGKDSPP
jgi:membrane protein required for colicin V production